ncbi:hypothetical protein [Teredinibacter sp. KSP-S5-2]|uniref:hypothetical protein n=1 Tax=Teredinibacter sp. KSP-S5-2 TaxID=3034506 RepID=UPI002934ABE0|nr:hypothetical protein [Teredinibacter sp. KSP-S5-2]WNO10297.1 hypothetical protein P5V12_03835 [Teredinibacter sp. KSP-S5-2]
MIKFLYLLFVGLMISVGACAETSWKNHVLVLAKPIKVEFKEDLSSVDEVYSGELYSVKMKALNVIKGSLREKTFTVDLFASHISLLKNKKRLYVLIEKNGGSLVGVSWASEQKVVCFPNGAVEDSSIIESFRIKDEYLKSVCLPIE